MTPKPAGEPIEVLLVEDDPGDVLLIREAFEFNKVHNNLNVVSDGEQALDYLRGTGDYVGRIRPDRASEHDEEKHRHNQRSHHAHWFADEHLRLHPRELPEAFQ